MSQAMSSTAHTESLKVIKFDGKNFSLWKMKIMALLEAADLLDVVVNPIAENLPKSKIGSVGSIQSLAVTRAQKPDSSAEEIAQLEKKSRKAFAIIINCLQDEQLQLVVQVPRGNAHEVWNILTQRYERTTTASKAHTRDMLHKCKMSSNESFDGYLGRVTQLVISLTEMKEPVSDGEMMYVLYNGLPREYESVIQSLKVNDNIKYEEACRHIRDREETLKIKQETTNSEAASEEAANHVNNESDRSNQRYKYNGFKTVGYRGKFNQGRGGFRGRTSS
jgi:hypothetical protein